jgi:methionyl-tRNA formyltransferase
MTLRLAFMGTPEFAVPSLAALVEAGHELVCVYTQPPRPAGRGRQTRPSPVAQRATALGLQVRWPTSLRDPEEQAFLAGLHLDAAVVVAYGLILTKPVLDAPRLGAVNLHPSLLPRWRGAAPIQHAILAGDGETGVAVMLMEEGLDTGPVLIVERVAIAACETAGELGHRLARLGAGLLPQALQGLAAGTLRPRPQPAEGITYAPKLGPGQARLDWRRPALHLHRQVRAFAPAPGAWFLHGEERIKVIEARIVEGQIVGASGPPGRVLGPGLTVACGEGALKILRAQRPGRAAMSEEALLRGYAIAPGTLLPVPEREA